MFGCKTGFLGIKNSLKTQKMFWQKSLDWRQRDARNAFFRYWIRFFLTELPTKNRSIVHEPVRVKTHASYYLQSVIHQAQEYIILYTAAFYRIIITYHHHYHHLIINCICSCKLKRDAAAAGSSTLTAIEKNKEAYWVWIPLMHVQYHWIYMLGCCCCCYSCGSLLLYPADMQHDI
jgi:hypothetical protein